MFSDSSDVQKRAEALPPKGQCAAENATGLFEVCASAAPLDCVHLQTRRRIGLENYCTKAGLNRRVDNLLREVEAWRVRHDTKAHELNLVILSARFKLGEAICEFGKNFLRGRFLECYRIGLGYLKKAARKLSRLSQGKVSYASPTHATAAAPFVNVGSVKYGLNSFKGVKIDCVPGLISVVLPIYNHSKFIVSAIEAILKQDHSNFELIIVNDGSTEPIEDVIKPFAQDSRIKYVQHVSNQRLPNALNTGFSHARGEFFTWTSADNIPETNWLSGLKSYLDQHLDTAMVFSGFNLIGHHGEALQSWTESTGSRVYWRTPLIHLNSSYNFVGGSFMYRSLAAKVVGNYSNIFSGAEDYDYWMRLNNLFKIAQHPDPLFTPYQYRFHHESLTGQAQEMRLTRLVSRLQQVDARRKGLAVSPLDLVTIGASSELAAQLSKALIKLEGELGFSEAVSSVVQCLLVCAWDTNASSDLVKLRALRHPDIVTALFVSDMQDYQACASEAVVDEFDFVLTASPSVLRLLKHPRAFLVPGLPDMAALISLVSRAVVIERSTDATSKRSIPVTVGFNA